MFSFLSKKKSAEAEINGQRITVQPRETVLQAALRQGIDFPHSCRVGGCASCKCRLIEGRVKELTEASYILSDEDLDRGYILACQSVPTTDVRIAVDLSAQQARRQVQGRVLAQDRLTHDTIRLRIQLDEALSYKAGQYANIAFASRPELVRSYSFATPMRADTQVHFFIRKVPGGAFSTLVNEHDLAGQTVVVDGPLGQFTLRADTTPLLMVAGGSGLAPILAILQGAVNDQVPRPVRLLFGARSERDLYALEDIHALADRWAAAFEFIPVLSEPEPDSGWSGARGLVTAHLANQLTPTPQAYLCGPPAMVDAAAQALRQLGVPADQMFTDRFTSVRDAVSAAA
ncbi:2Fe-2S iron-sulfur cluster-binding protein [Aquabacterium sp.]|uniref:2Fe-2S iron-sulfur cluster-binding protein n=1 Tax=Aquabacterium sp. TaxID=1872578 RepID=UPI0035B4A0B5